jgi:hypothetical protein
VGLAAEFQDVGTNAYGEVETTRKEMRMGYFTAFSRQVHGGIEMNDYTERLVSTFPDEVIAFFNLPNPSSRTMALESTQPLTEMSIRNLPGSKGRPGRKANSLTDICEPTVYKMWEPRCLKTLWACTAC